MSTDLVDPVVTDGAVVASVSGERVPNPRTGLLTRCAPTLRTTLSRPSMLTVAVHVRGELGAESAPQLQAMLTPRLVSQIHTLIVDLSGLDFLGVAGLGVLLRTRRHAHSLGIALWLVTGRRRCVERALRAGGLQGVQPCSHDLDTALAAIPRLGWAPSVEGSRVK